MVRKSNNLVVRDAPCKTLSLPLKAASPTKIPLSRTQSIAPTLALPAELIEQRPADAEKSICKSRSAENVAQLLPAFHPLHPPPPLPPIPSGDECPNRHRKVQRQLTINPYYLKAPPYPPPPFAVHSIVTRNASAPVSQQVHPQSNGHAAHMHRLNSTSDTQLNLYASQQSLGDPFDEWSHPPPPQRTQRIQQPVKATELVLYLYSLILILIFWFFLED